MKVEFIREEIIPTPPPLKEVVIRLSPQEASNLKELIGRTNPRHYYQLMYDYLNRVELPVPEFKVVDTIRLHD